MLTLERLKDVISYNPETGLFVWRRARQNVRAGVEAGNINKTLGYMQIGIDQIQYYGHRLAWFYHYGEMPEFEIDHKNGNRLDNRIDNLRNATSQQNKFNCKKRPPRSRSGTPYSKHKGVVFHNGGWRASITFNRKHIHLGVYIIECDAAAAYERASKRIFGEYAGIR